MINARCQNVIKNQTAHRKVTGMSAERQKERKRQNGIVRALHSMQQLNNDLALI